MPWNGRTWNPPTTTTFTYRAPVTQHAGPLQAAAAYPTLLAPINVPSEDGRVIVDELGWREPPLPFMASDSELGHGDAIHVGTLNQFGTVTKDDQRWVAAVLRYDTDEDAQEFERLAVDQGFRFVSIHMGTARWGLAYQEDDGSFRELSWSEFDEMIDDADDEDAVQALVARVYDGFFDAEIAAATQVAIPAFPGAQIQVDEAVQEDDDEEPATEEPDEEMALAAAATGVDLMRPPADWFTSPDLTEPTALTVTDDGRVFGHLALWDTCHTGYHGRCVTVPRQADYSLFLQCSVTTDAGDRLRVGPLVVDEGHAPVDWTVSRAIAHYSQTALTAAYVAIGHDDHGVWVAGAVSPNATDAMRETLGRHPLSGDWRDMDGQLRLVAAVSVNNPGFPVQPRVLVASADEEPVGLITVGPGVDDDADLSPIEVLAYASRNLARGQDDIVARLNRFEALLERIAPDPDLAAALDRFTEPDPAVDSPDMDAVLARFAD